MNIDISFEESKLKIVKSKLNDKLSLNIVKELCGTKHPEALELTE